MPYEDRKPDQFGRELHPIEEVPWKKEPGHAFTIKDQ
jgi:hypothetical protein